MMSKAKKMITTLNDTSSEILGTATTMIVTEVVMEAMVMNAIVRPALPDPLVLMV